MKLMIRALIAITMATLMAACQSTDNGVRLQTSPTNPQIFRLGNETYTVAEYQAYLDAQIGQGIADLLQQGQTPEQIQQLAIDQNVPRMVFDSMLQEALLVQYARAAGVGVDQAEVDKALAASAPAFDPAEPFKDMTGSRLSAARGLLALTVKAQNSHIDMYHARHIMLQDEAAADAALAELQSGGDFATLAASRSTDTGSSGNGGDLGWQLRGAFVPELEEPGFSLALNTPTKIQTPYGWHVFEVLERENQRALSLEQIQSIESGGPQVAQPILDAAGFTAWYEQLRTEAAASGDLAIAPGFDPNSVPLPFPEQ